MQATWNYCTQVPGVSAYATLTGPDGVAQVVADEIIAPGDATNIDDADGNLIGLSIVQGSSTACASDATKTWELKTNLYCDASVTGAATVDSVSIVDCSLVVNMKHDDGCATLDVSEYLGWLSENEWAIGILYLIIGPCLALFGQQWFPWVTASLVAVFVMGTICSLSLAFGWMTSTTGTIVVLVVALILGVVAGILVRRNIKIMVALLGGVAGFFLGALLFALIANFSGWTAVWGYWLVSSLMAVVGVVLSYYIGLTLVLISTAFVGSYLFMRSWTLFFPGHYPSESQLMNDAANL